MYHFLITTNPTVPRLFQAETLVKSLKAFSGLAQVDVTLVLTSNSLTESLDMTLKPTKSKNAYLDKNCEVLSSNTHWSTHPPVRWFVQPKHDTCVFLDTDVLAAGPIEFDTQGKFWGMLAHSAPFKMDLWQKFSRACAFDLPNKKYLSMHTKEAMPYYVNFGVLFVPSFLVTKMRNNLLINMKVANKFFYSTLNNNYYASQAALTATIYQLGIPHDELPLRYNYSDFPVHDKHSPEEMNNCVLYHYLHLKNEMSSENACKAFAKSQTTVINHRIPRKIIRKIFYPAIKLL